MQASPLKLPNLFVLFSVFCLIGCGGEGSEPSTPSGSTSTGTSAPANTAPQVAAPNQNFSVTAGQPVEYDVSQGGTSFTDTDGDSLTYTISFQSFDRNNTSIDNELSATGTIVSGTPVTVGTVFVTVTVSDGRGGSASDAFEIAITEAVDENAPALPAVSFEYVDIDLPDHFTNPNSDFGDVAGQDNQPVNSNITNAGATLGRVLFYDKKLSVNDSVSCASCHQQEFGFSDPNVLSIGFEGGETGRHSMGLANARYYERGRFFWDERANTLEDQVLQPIQDAVEMGMTLSALETKLAGTSYYPQLFEDAFGSSAVTSGRIADALAQFIRSMVSFQSKFDQAFEGGDAENPDFQSVFTAQELQGLRLFTDEINIPGRTLRCNGCHGTAVQTAENPQNNGLDADTSDDQGAGGGRFKVPSLRNIAVRAPYMHDSRFSTLEEVVEFYNSGIQAHPNLGGRLENNGQPRRFNMTDAEKAALVAFMNTLTDNVFLTDEKFSDPFPED